MSEENKAVVRRLIAEVINEHDPHAAERFFTPNFVEHIPAPGQGQGLEGMRRWLEEVYFPAFPDVHWSAEEQLQKGTRCSLASSGVAPIGASSRAYLPPTSR